MIKRKGWLHWDVVSSDLYDVLEIVADRLDVVDQDVPRDITDIPTLKHSLDRRRIPTPSPEAMEAVATAVIIQMITTCDKMGIVLKESHIDLIYCRNWWELEDPRLHY